MPRRSAICSTFHDMRVLVTRAREQASALVRALADSGFEPVLVPTIRFELESFDLPACDWVVVTSTNAVRSLGARPLAGALLAAVGPETAAAARNDGYDVSLVARPSTGVALVAAFADGPGTVALVHADRAFPTVRSGLVAKGWSVQALVGYRTVVGAVGALPDVGVDAVTFASPSAAQGFVDSFGLDAVPRLVVSIGPTTSAVCDALGIRVTAEATPHSVSGMVDALRRVATR